MASNADYVLPGHHEPIGAWSSVQLVNALDDLRFDKAAGFAAPETDTAIAALRIEIERREAGGQAEPERAERAESRALERWLPEEVHAMPMVRGQEAGAALIAAPEPQALREAQALQGKEGALELEGVEAGSRRATLSLVWDKAEAAPVLAPAQGVEAEQDQGLERD